MSQIETTRNARGVAVYGQCVGNFFLILTLFEYNFKSNIVDFF